jgi:hypothetical protein
MLRSGRRRRVRGRGWAEGGGDYEEDEGDGRKAEQVTRRTKGMLRRGRR